MQNNHPNKNEIAYLVNKGIINGFQDGSFKPGNTVTNGQVAMMVARALKLNLISRPNPGFTDVFSTTSGFKEIAALVDEGIIPKGSTFHPGSPISRESMARILVNAFKLEGVNPINFTDVSTSYWAYPYISKLAANNVTVGYSNGTFKPKNSVTRAHFSAFMARALDPAFKPITSELLLSNLSIGGLIPNKDIVEAIGRFEKNYKVDVDLAETSYITGDPTSAMSWFMSLSPDKNGKIINVEYEQFKEGKTGIANANIKGIKVGSDISTVFKLFGESRNIDRSTALPYHYVDVSYDLKVKETGQSVTIIFSLRYSSKQQESQAKVYGLAYKLSPLKDVVEKPVIKPVPPKVNEKKAVYNGKTIKTGMTKSEVSKLLGKPREIRKPLAGSAEVRERMKQLLGAEQFNLMDIEQWTYQTQWYKENRVETIAIIFNYKGIAIEVLDFKSDW